MTFKGHLDSEGRAHMVDVGRKAVSERFAAAGVVVRMSPEGYRIAVEGSAAKGDLLTVAKLAGIQAAKQTATLIPLCHPVPVHHVDLSFHFDERAHTLTIRAEVRAEWHTGVEMEALTACAVAALTVYDMLKATGREMTISDLRLLEKRGGSSGDYVRADT